jgi:hypothetical protein
MLNPNTNQITEFMVEASGDVSIEVSFGNLLSSASPGDPFNVSFRGWRSDDDLLREEDLPQPGATNVGEAFAQAYIEVLEDTGHDDFHTPWHDRFLTDGTYEYEIDYLRRFRQTEDDDFYWVAHVATLYATFLEDYDNDPDEELGCCGASHGPQPKVACVYEEVVRDVGEQWGFGRAAIKPLTTLHEIGHQFRLEDNHDNSNCMWAPESDNEESYMPLVPCVFSLADIDRLRLLSERP